MNATRSSSSPCVITDAGELTEQVERARRAGKTIGIVPTMGALHAGHLSLVDAARRQCDFTIVTIFVNPTQFAAGEDFERYPRTLESDLESLAGREVDLVFAPSTDSMYSKGHATYVEIEGPALVLEGEFRPGHFRGVATIVLKLFNIARPDRAYFGRKDYQQAMLMRRMVDDLNLPVRIEVCPIVREPDGLALSSRNVYLSASERQRALAISQSLKLAGQLVEQGTRDASTILKQMHALLADAQLAVDYVALVDPETLEPVDTVNQPTLAAIAASVGKTRLIDNATIGP